jgi:hypothetical protein
MEVTISLLLVQGVGVRGAKPPLPCPFMDCAAEASNSPINSYNQKSLQIHIYESRYKWRQTFVT